MDYTYAKTLFMVYLKVRFNWVFPAFSWQSWKWSELWGHWEIVPYIMDKVSLIVVATESGG